MLLWRGRILATVVTALCACSRSTEPPAPAPAPSAPQPPHSLAWDVVVVPECGFSVELPGRIERVVDDGAGVPTTMYEAAETAPRLMAECTVFPPDMQLPNTDTFFQRIVDRHEHTLDGLGGGVKRRDVRPAAGPVPSVTYSLEFFNGKAVAGQMILADRQLREMSGIVDGPESEEELARLMKSYRTSL